MIRSDSNSSIASSSSAVGLLTKKKENVKMKNLVFFAPYSKFIL